MADPEETKKKLEKLRQDQDALKAQLTELEEYMHRKYRKPKPRTYPAYPTPTYAEPQPTPPPTYRKRYAYAPPAVSTTTDIDELKDLLLRNLDEMKKLMAKYDYLLDALLSSLEEASSEDIDKTIMLIAQTQAHMADAIGMIQETTEKLEKSGLTKEDLNKFKQEFQERYIEVTDRLGEIIKAIQEPVFMDTLTSMEVQVSNMSEELKRIDEELKKGLNEELIERMKEFGVKIEGFDERLRAINEIVEGLKGHVYATEASAAKIANIEKQLAEMRKILEANQKAILEETSSQKIEIEKALAGFKEAGKAVEELKELGDIGDKLAEIEKLKEAEEREIEKLSELEEKLKKVDELENRLANMETKINRISRFVDVYPIGEVHELSTIKREIEKVKPSLPRVIIESLEKKLGAIESILKKIERRREIEKKEEENRIEEILTRIEKKIEEASVSGKEITEIEERLEEIKQGLEDVKRLREQVKEGKEEGETLLKLEERINDISKGINELSSVVKQMTMEEKADISNLSKDLREIEARLEGLQKLPKKEVERESKSLAKEIKLMENRLAKLEKTQEKEELKDIRQDIENVKKGIELIEKRVETELMESVKRKYSELAERIGKLETMVKLEGIGKEDVKKELNEIEKKIRDMRELIGKKKGFAGVDKELKKLEDEVKAAKRVKSVKKGVERVKKAAELVSPHPSLKAKKAASRIFSVRKGIEAGEKPAVGEVRLALKEVRELEKFVEGMGLEKRVKRLRTNLEKIKKNLARYPKKYIPKLAEMEKELMQVSREIDKINSEILLIGRLEEKLKNKEEELQELNYRIASGKAEAEEVKDKIERISREIDEIRKRIGLETLKVYKLVKKIGELKNRTRNILPLAEARKKLAMLRKAIEKGRVKKAREYAKEVRTILKKRKSEEAKGLDRELDNLLAKLEGASKGKEKLARRLEKKERTALFPKLFAAIEGLIHAHRKKPGVVVVEKEKAQKAKEEIEKAKGTLEEVKRNVAKPTKLKKAKEKMLVAETELGTKKVKVLPKKEIEETVRTAKKEIEETRKEIEKERPGWVAGLIAQKRIELSQEELKEIAKALKKSEEIHEKALRAVKSSRKEMEKAIINKEFALMEIIENMKSGEKAYLEDIAKSMRVSPKELLDLVKRIKGNFKLMDAGFIARLLGRKPYIVKI